MAGPYPGLDPIKPRAACADTQSVTTPRAVSLLAAFASPIFLAAAIAGWLYDVWPATPLTFGIACFVVAGGPILGIYHVATVDFGDEDEDSYVEEPTAILRPVVTRAAAPAPLPLTPKAADAKAFTSWRDRPNEALVHRERERQANAYVR